MLREGENNKRRFVEMVTKIFRAIGGEKLK